VSLACSVRLARSSDAGALATLVNRAYAVEEFFVEGERTTADEIARMMRSGKFVVLEDEGTLAAAVYVEAQRAYFGMLSVDPSCQQRGLGKRLVTIAEAWASAMGAPAVDLKIVNLREELGRWYRSLGYREVGTAPYDHRPVKRACHFVEMRKSLVAAA
jgi:N-acetylglutamate synthase-like GNAT family acetyltransferase